MQEHKSNPPDQLNGSAPKPLTREQRRQVERTTKEAMVRFNKFANDFSDWMYDTPDLTDEMVAERVKQIDAKWQVYCRYMNLDLKSKDAIKDFCKELYNHYKVELKGGENPVAG